MTQEPENKPTLKSYLFTGILVSAPIAITFYLAVQLFVVIDQWATNFIPEKYNPNTYLTYGAPGLGVLLLLVFWVLIGMLTANFAGQWMMHLGERIIQKMPVISGVYNAFHKLFETFLGKGKNSAFRQAVLIEYPRKGLWTIAFLTGPVFEGIQSCVEDDLLAVFVPTTPNPTSGFLIYVPKKDVILLDMRVDEAFKLIISTGIVNPTIKKIKPKDPLKKK